MEAIVAIIRLGLDAWTLVWMLTLIIHLVGVHLRHGMTLILVLRRSSVIVSDIGWNRGRVIDDGSNGLWLGVPGEGSNIKLCQL